jgi:SSS family solute:Na+ symporter
MDITIVFIYFLGLIFVGSRSFKIVKGVDSFFVADRRVTYLFVVGSLFATIIGGSSTIGMAGLGYRQGLVGSWWLLVGAIGLFFLGLFLAEKVRGYSLYTLPEILEVQYGPEAKLFASGLIVIAWTGIIAGQIVAAGKILEVILKAPPSLLMIITAFVFIIYTLLGGQHSVVRTDTIQSMIIIIAILASIPLCLGKVGGVFLMREALGGDYFSFPVNQYFTWKSLATYLFLVGSTYLVGPDIYSRLFCSKNEKIAKRATITVALGLIPFAFIITMIGMAARVLFPQISPEASFPTMINHLFPIGLNGLVIAALLSAMMSSADTCLLTTSTILSVDIIKPLLKPVIEDRKLLLLSRIFIVLIGIFSLFIALTLKGVISSLLLGYTVYTSGLVFPILLGFFRHRLNLNRGGAILAMVAGGGLALIGKLLGLSDFGLYGFFLSGIILIVGSRFFQFMKIR